MASKDKGGGQFQELSQAANLEVKGACCPLTLHGGQAAAHPRHHPDPGSCSVMLCCFLGGLVSGSPNNGCLFMPYLPSGFRGSTERTPGLPTLQKIQPTPGWKEADKQAFVWLRACKQGLLSGLPSGICVPWVPQWKEQGTQREK